MKRERYAKHALVASLALCAPACSSPGAAAGPDARIALVASSPNRVTVEYALAYDGAFRAANRLAQAECARHGRHADLVGTTWRDVDRIMATFRCMQ
jgi:hypothetical protein